MQCHYSPVNVIRELLTLKKLMFAAEDVI